MKTKLLFLIFIILFAGCSSRQYFEPKKTDTLNLDFKDLNSSIKYFTRDVATLENNKVIDTNTKVSKNFVAIDSEISKYANILKVNDKNITFNKLIVTAAKRANLLAVILADNTFKLIDLDDNKTITSQNFGEVLANRKFIAKPYFYKDLILIPTLNGKLAVYDITSNKIVRNIVLSKQDYFNNIIYLGVRENNLIVASRDVILVISPGMIYDAEYNIKHLLVSDYNIYVFTIEGDVIKLDLTLKEIKRKSFKFANIVAPVFSGKYIYFMDNGKNSYLIRVNRDLENEKIYKLGINLNDVNVFSKNGKIYIGNKYLDLKDIK